MVNNSKLSEKNHTFTHRSAKWMKGVCKLIQPECELQNSHVYPTFVIEWMKSTGSKHWRGYTQPNRRLQDGYKKIPSVKSSGIII